MSVSSFETGEGFSPRRQTPHPPSLARGHLLPQGEKEGARLYEIPITSPLRPSRKPMRLVAPQPGKTRKPSIRLAAHVAQEHPMLDIVMLALALGFFVAGIGYAYACERL
jgi:hypothetical protein